MVFGNLSTGYWLGAAGGGADTNPHWQEIGRTTLGSNGHTISVTSLADKPYIMFLSHQITSGSGQIDGHGQLNGDTGSNYAKRESDDGAADGSGSSQTSFVTGKGNGAAADNFVVGNILNITAQEKLIMSHATGGTAAGAGNVPSRREAVNKWANTSNAVSSIQLLSGYAGANDFATGSECVVLGYDPADTTGTNAWEELADVDWTSGATLDSGTFTAKKYLYFETYFDQASGSNDPYLQFNGDTGSNYAWRMSTNGATDVTYGSQSYGVNITGITVPRLYSGYIINKSDKEKLCIMSCVRTAAGGAGTAPDREEAVFKWANTSAQITQIEINAQTGNLSTGNIKVWGFD